jgi:hypothetical protein
LTHVLVGEQRFALANRIPLRPDMRYRDRTRAMASRRIRAIDALKTSLPPFFDFEVGRFHASAVSPRIGMTGLVSPVSSCKQELLSAA